MEARHRQHSRLERLGIAADQGLQGLHQGARGNHGIGRLLRHRGVAAAAGDANLEAVGAGHDRAAQNGHLPRRQAWPVVQAEYRLHRELFEQTLLDHDATAAIPLLGRLENEMHRAFEVSLAAQRRQSLGRTQQHRGMAVMTAGMHLSRMARAVLEGIEFVERQRVHVGAQADGATAAAGLQAADHAGAGQAAMHRQAERLEFFRHDIGGAPFAEGEFRMGMDVAADGRDAGVQIGDQIVEFHVDSCILAGAP